MAETRLPAHLEVAGLIRAVETAGGFAMILQKGERDAGTIVVVLAEKGGNARIFERMPQADGTRKWALSKTQEIDNTDDFSDYLVRRGKQDSDLWIVELDIANGERFIGLESPTG
jgi:hypothetical protein